MATDRSGSPGIVRLLALAGLAVLVVGVSFVSARSDPEGPTPGVIERAPPVATDVDVAGEPEPPAPPEAIEVDKPEKDDLISTDGDGADEGPAQPPAATMTEPAEVSIAAVGRLVTEDSAAVFTLTRGGGATTALTVSVRVTESASVLAGDGRETVTFAAGESAATLSVGLDDDSEVEATSRVTATITAGTGYVVAEHGGAADLYVADNDRIFLLPDLVSDPPEPWGEAQVVRWGGASMLVLRFEGYVTNLGDGPLDLSGDPRLSDPDDPTSHDVWQRVRTSTGDWVSLTKPPVRYETNDGHNHFHLMEIVAYSLWDEAGTTQVLPGSKVGFCMVDVEALPDRHPEPGEAMYNEKLIENCRANQPDADHLRMGITEGWRDVYDGTVTLQWVDVSELSPGNYRLAAESDPYDIVVETDETNNGVAIAEGISVVPGYVAQPLAVETEPGTAVQVVLEAAAFGSPGTRVFRVVTPPANGTLDAAAGVTLWGTVLWYTPGEGFTGVDTFEYVAFDWSSAFPRTDPLATVAIGVGVPAPAPEQAGAGGVAGPSVAGANTAPVITPPGAQRFAIADSVDVNIAAADVEGDTLTWSVDVLPAGLAMVAQTGRIVGNPTAAGSTLSTVTVSDGELSSLVTISWEITAP